MHSTIHDARTVRVVQLCFPFLADRPIAVSPLLGRELHGALGSRLDDLERNAPTDEEACRYRQAHALLREPVTASDRSGTRSKGALHAPLFALDVPWSVAPVGPSTPLICSAVLFASLAELWDTWPDALACVDLNGCCLRCDTAYVATPGGLVPADAFSGNPQAAIASLADLAGPGLPDTHRLRLHMRTPTAWGKQTSADPRSSDWPLHLVRGLYDRITMLASLNPDHSPSATTPSPSPILQQLAGAVQVTGFSFAQVSARYHGQSTTIRGLIGHVDIASRARGRGRGLPREFLDLLLLATVTGFGSATSFGCGRIQLELPTD